MSRADDTRVPVGIRLRHDGSGEGRRRAGENGRRGRRPQRAKISPRGKGVMCSTTRRVRHVQLTRAAVRRGHCMSSMSATSPTSSHGRGQPNAGSLGATSWTCPPRASLVSCGIARAARHKGRSPGYRTVRPHRFAVDVPAVGSRDPVTRLLLKLAFGEDGGSPLPQAQRCGWDHSRPARPPRSTSWRGSGPRRQCGAPRRRTASRRRCRSDRS